MAAVVAAAAGTSRVSGPPAGARRGRVSGDGPRLGSLAAAAAAGVEGPCSSSTVVRWAPDSSGRRSPACAPRGASVSRAPSGGPRSVGASRDASGCGRWRSRSARRSSPTPTLPTRPPPDSGGRPSPFHLQLGEMEIALAFIYPSMHPYIHLL